MEKRDILVKRVKDARESQQEAKDEFKTALERFKSVIEVDGGPLEDKYEKLDKELNRSEDRARKVRDRIDSVRSVSDDLFKEWDQELRRYSDRSLRAESERQLKIDAAALRGAHQIDGAGAEAPRARAQAAARSGVVPEAQPERASHRCPRRRVADGPHQRRCARDRSRSRHRGSRPVRRLDGEHQLTEPLSVWCSGRTAQGLGVGASDLNPPIPNP